MENQNYIIQLSMIQEEGKKLEEQLNIVDSQIKEFYSLKESLDSLKDIKDNKFLSSLGRGVFVESKVNSNEFFVNVGNNVVLRKSSEETKEIIDKQIKELNNIKSQILATIENLNLELQNIIEQARKGGN
jgi:prefoldin alpha subunit